MIEQKKQVTRTLRALFQIILLIVTSSGMAHASMQVGGFVPGGNIADHLKLVKMETVLPIRYKPFLKEVEIEKQTGFKSGLILYGSCAEPGQILRVKLKYSDSSKSFFDELFKRYKQRFGKPSEWKGDSFGIIQAWKWSLKDDQNGSISMILQHNTQDSDQKIGNVIKITMWGLIDLEERCAQLRNREGRKQSAKRVNKARTQEKIDWARLIPSKAK